MIKEKEKTGAPLLGAFARSGNCLKEMNSIKTIAQALFVVVVSASSFAADTWLVRYDGVGPVKIGMTLTQLTALFHQKLAEQDSGVDNCYYVTVPGHDHIGFMILDGRVARLDVNRPGVMTTTGIQVGDSEAHARKIYGEKLKITEHTYIDTGHYLTVRSADGRYGVRFETDSGKITGYYAGKYEAIQYVEGCE